MKNFNEWLKTRELLENQHTFTQPQAPAWWGLRAPLATELIKKPASAVISGMGNAFTKQLYPHGGGASEHPNYFDSKSSKESPQIKTRIVGHNAEGGVIMEVPRGTDIEKLKSMVLSDPAYGDDFKNYNIDFNNVRSVVNNDQTNSTLVHFPVNSNVSPIMQYKSLESLLKQQPQQQWQQSQFGKYAAKPQTPETQQQQMQQQQMQQQFQQWQQHQQRQQPQQRQQQQT
jgi:hypothetical protein